MIAQHRLRDRPTVDAACQLAQLLTAARAYLASFRPRVCARCGHVFSPDLRLDMRCPDCAAKEASDA